jgi:hypothetical protein
MRYDRSQDSENADAVLARQIHRSDALEIASLNHDDTISKRLPPVMNEEGILKWG